MPQWIKIQPLFEINNTQNIQRILECFTARVLTTFSGSTWTNVPTRHKWPRGDWGHIPITYTNAFLSLGFFSHPHIKSFCLDTRQGALILLECTPDWTVSHATMQYHSTPAEGGTLNTWSKVSIQYCLRLQIERYVQRRRNSLSLLAFFSTL